MEHLTAVILAGGRGLRLGEEKADLRLGGRSLLEIALGLAAQVAGERIVVVRAGQSVGADGARVVPDLLPGAGPLAALLSGLEAARTRRCLVMACDMPFVRPAVARFLISQAPQAEVVVPRSSDGLHPLLGVYGVECAEAIRACLERGERRVVSFYRQVRVAEVDAEGLRPLDPDLLSLFNINTPRDYARAREIADASRTVRGRRA